MSIHYRIMRRLRITRRAVNFLPLALVLVFCVIVYINAKGGAA